ncbi:MAG: endonuclease/exonuclease/phosphatase family protein [Ferruginibacter sp.]
MTKRLKKIIWPAFVTGNCLALLLGMLADIAPFIHSGRFPLVALLGLAFPLLFLGNSLLAAYWFYKKSRWRWPSVVVLLLGLYQLSMVFGFRVPAKFDRSKDDHTLRIVTWNLSSWGLTNRNNYSGASYRHEMTELLKTTDADVICLQEYHFLNTLSFRDSVIPELAKNGYRYSYFARKLYTVPVPDSATITGVAIVSRIPIIDSACFHYKDPEDAEPLLSADILFNNQRIRIFTAHLQSVRFNPYDYAALHNLKNPGNASISRSRAVGGKLKIAYKKRAEQAAFFHSRIKQSPWPVIVCGDFNDVPGSYTYTSIRDNLQDAFLKKSFGFGRTYRFLSPTLRIDFILADKKFSVAQYRKYEVDYSDHYPVLADLHWNH